MNGHQRRQRFSPRVVMTFLLACAAFAVPFGVFATSTFAPATQVTPSPESTAVPIPTEEPQPTDPAPTEPLPTDSAPTEPLPTDPAPTEPPPTEPAAPIAAPFIVSFRAGLWGDHTVAVAAVGGEVVSSIPELRMASVLLPSASAAVELRSDPAVSAVEPDRTRQAEATPSDILFTDQWALPRIGWDEAYGVANPAADTIVAILDTGVRADHEDLAGRLVGGASFVDGSTPDHDPNGHGTWMAGIVAGATDNATGISGVSWGAVRVLPVVVLDAQGLGQDSAVIQGLVHAVESGASVALLAFSSGSYSVALQAAIDYAWAHDVVVVAATGNEGSTAPSYPAGDRGVVGVASTDRADALTPGSNSGPAAFIGAPGVDIFTTDVDGGYRAINGTSAAAAMVAGAAALMRSTDPELDNAVIVARLARSAAPLNTGQAGNGRLALARALADTNTAGVQPQGAAPNGSGGPFLGPYMAAAAATWTGGGTDNNWTTADNWGGTAPVAGDDLVFPDGAARLSNTNDFGAGTSFNSITISGSGYTLAGNSVALGAGGLVSSGAGTTNTMTLPMSMAADRMVTVTDASSTLTLGGIASGLGGLIKGGSGVLALSSANTFSGATSLTAGSIDVQANAALGTTGSNTTVTLGAGLTVNGSGLTVAEPVILNGTGNSGAGALVNLANTNTWSGALTLASATTVGSAAGTLTLSGAVTTAGHVLTVDGAGNVTKSAGVISGTGGVTKDGSGTLTFGLANSYTGATTVNVGTLRLSIANGVGGSSAVTVAAGATFDLNGFADTVGSIAGDGHVTNTAAASATLTCGGNNSSTTFSGVLADGGGPLLLTKAGSGTLTLTGANTYSGLTRINAGTLSIASDGVLGPAPAGPTAGQLTFGGGTLRTTATFELSANRGIAMSGVGTLSVDPTTTLTYGGVIEGASTLTKSGTGTLVLSGANVYSSVTAITAGVVRVEADTALGATSAGTTVSSGAAIEINGTGLVLAEPVTSLNGTGVSASGAIRNLANDNTWSGAITLAGTTRVNSDGGTVTFSDGVSAGTRALTVGGTGNWNIGGISGTTATLTKDGAGTVTLTAANTYTGATTVNAGTLMLGAPNSIGASSALTVASGATFDMVGFSDMVGSLAGAGNVTSSVAGAVTLTCGGLNTSTTFSGVVASGSGSVGLTKVGTGTLTLSGVNTYTGATTINAGTVGVAADTALGTPPGSPSAGQLTFGGGTLLVSATFTLDSNRGAALAGAGTVSTNSGVTLTYGGAIAGAGSLTKVGTGTLVLSGSSTYDGATTLTAGTLNINGDSALGTAPGAPTSGHLTIATATLVASGSFTLDSNRGIALTGAATVSTSPGVTLTSGGGIAGIGALTKTGAGTLELAGANTYSGATTVSVGVVRIQSSDALGASATGTSVTSGAAIEIDGTSLAVVEPIGSLNGTGVALGGALRNLGNDNDWSGAITLVGTTRVNSDGGTLSFSNGINANTRSLTLGGAGNSNVAAIAGTTATLTKDGAGTLTLSDAATYTGATAVNAGTLRLGTANAIGPSSATTVASGATLDLAGFDGSLGSLAGAGNVTSSVAGPVTLTVGGLNTSTTFSGVLSDGSGAVTLTKVGTGTSTLSGANTYTGATTISAGTISVATNAGLGADPGSPAAGHLTFGGGTLLATASFTLNADRGIALTGAGTISVNSSVTLTYGGEIAGSGSLTKVGTGTLVLSGSNTHTGTTTLTAGTLSVGTDAALGAVPGSPTPGHIVFGGGTLLASASFTLDANRGIALTGAGTLSTNASVTLAYGGVIAGAANLTKAGSGTLVLSGTNTYTGATTIDLGTLSIAADSALGAAPGSPTAGLLNFAGATLLATESFTLDANRGVVLTSTGTISVDPTMTLTYDGEIAGASTLTKTGTGTLVLSGANTYSGASTVSAGVLRVQSAAAFGGTATGTSVTSGATIEIDGSSMTITEPITSLIGSGVSAGGALRNLANDNTWSGAIVLGSGGARVNSDGGTLTLSGGITGNARPLTVGGGGEALISEVIATTTGTLTKDGAGTLTLSAANTYTGATSVSAGTIKLAIADAVGASSALSVSSGATFDLAGFSDTVGSLAGAGSVTSSAAGSMTLTAGGVNTSTTYSGVLSDGLGVVSLTKVGTGTLTVSGPSTYTGATTINGGTVSVAADTALGTPPSFPSAGQLTFGGGTLLATASFTLDDHRGIAFTGAGTFSVNSSVTLTYGGVAAGAGSVSKVGTGTLVLSGLNTYTGATNITAGTLSIPTDAALGAVPGLPTAAHVAFGGGTLLASASFTLDANRGIALTSAGTVSVDPIMTLSYGGEIAGPSNLTKTGLGTLILSGTNTYTGTTTVSGGVLRVQNTAALGATETGTTVTSGEALEIDGAGLVIAEPVNITGTGVAAAGALRNLGNDNTWSGLITLAGTTRVNSDGGTFTVGGGVDASTRALTVGGVGNWDISAITGTSATLTKDGAGTLTLYPINTYAGRTTLNGGITYITADAALGTPPVVPTGSLLTFGGGTLATTTSFTLDSNRGISWGSGGGTIDVAAGTTLTYAGIATGSSSSGVTTKSGSGTLDFSAATSTSGGLTISAGTLIAPVATTFDVNGDLTNNSGLGALVTGTGTVTLSRANGGQLIGGAFPVDFYGLTVSNPIGITLGFDMTVAGTLTFSSGNIITGAQVLHVAEGGSVSQTSGHVVGFLRKHVATGSPSLTFEVGDASQYAPVALVFGDVSVAGELTVSTASGDHASLAASTLDPAASVNRYWTLAGSGIAFTDYDATFNFGAGDIDVGAEPNDFGVARYATATWQSLATSGQTATSSVGNDVTGFGEFAVGEISAGALDHFVVSAPPTAVAGTPVDVTVTAVDSVGNRIGSYVGFITFSSSDTHAAFAPPDYTFLSTDQGTKTFVGGTTLYAAGTHTVSVAAGPAIGNSAAIDATVGAFVKLQVLVPGESADPGSATGETGTPTAQSANAPVLVTVNAVDAYWNLVAGATDTIAITSSDPAAVLPPDAALVAGSGSFAITFQTGGATTVTATDATDGTKTAHTSSAIDVTNAAPLVAADSYELFANNPLVVGAPGVLANDTDAELQALTVGLPRPQSWPTHGTLVLNADGSFVYTPFAGYDGPDSFTYTATDGYTTSAEATVNLTVRDHSLISASGWDTSFAAGRYLDFTFPAYVPAGSVVSGVTFHFSYRSLDAAGTSCHYFEVYEGATLLATHGSPGSPVSCNSSAAYAADAIALAEVDSATEANGLTVRVYMRDSAGARSQINLATVSFDYYLP